MKKIIKKLFTPFAVFVIALGIGVSLSAPKEVEGVKAAETAVISYSGSTTTNMTGGNDAALYGLADKPFSLVSDKGGTNYHVGVNKAGHFRLYASSGEGTILSVSLTDNSYHITGFTINYGSTVAQAKIVVDGIEKINETPNANGVHSLSNLSATAFSIQNVGTKQIYINTISIDYDLKSSPSVNITNGPGNLEVGEEFQFSATTANVEGTPTISWSVEDEEVASINSSGLLTTIAPGSTNVVASITVEGITYTHKVLINVLHDEPEAIQVTIGEILEVENSKATLYKGVARIKGWGTDGTGNKDQYGNMRLTDIDGSAEIAVYGSSFEEGIISFNKVTGLFEYSTRYSFLEDSRSIALEAGDIIEFDAIRNDYQGTPQLNVRIKSVVDEDYTAARDFADDVVNGEGLNAQDNCEVVHASLMTKYNALSEGAKEVFEENTEAIFVSARARLAYLNSWVAAQPGSNPTRQSTSDQSRNNLVAVISIGAIGLTFILGYYFVSKKKKLS
ncbi:MAG: hypothetical protein WDA59_01115 [Methanofastidiosum sp.]